VSHGRKLAGSHGSPCFARALSARLVSFVGGRKSPSQFPFETVIDDPVVLEKLKYTFEIPSVDCMS